MIDRRIVKTKKTLKQTLIQMLEEIPFEQISITELCRRAEISRITFYSHYNDKYALVDEIFEDMVEVGTKDYQRRQLENNPMDDLVQGYCNVLDSILYIYYEKFEFFRHTNPSRSPYLAFAFYSIVLNTVEMHTNRIQRDLRLKYSAKKIAGFLCFGMLGFINECHGEKVPIENMKKEAGWLLRDVLQSEILVERTGE